MKFSHFFIDRPIFAVVISVLITLIGIGAYPLLPLAQYPEIAPPTVAVTASYPGASAETLAETVAAPLEQGINGVEGMLYMTSSSANGQTVIRVTFRQGTNLDAAQVLVQNRVALAEPRLPEQVRQVGVTVDKQATGFLLIVSLTSSDPTMTIDEIGNYANSRLRDQLLRSPGIGAISIFGGGLYAMRIWIDPGKAAERNLTSTEIIAALRAQNIQASGGALGQPPFDTNVADQLPVEVQSRLSSPEEFADVVIRTDADGRATRVRDVARVELGSQDYSIRGYFSGERSVAVAVVQQPGSNALDAAKGVLDLVEKARPDFPPGISYTISYNPTEYVAASVEEVQRTLVEAVILVVIVVLVFLQTWRAAIIPIVAIPIALVGTFAVQLALGFSINSLSLFALVLAVGIVVDDAIVVVENVERNIRAGMSPRDAAYRTMDEVTGALIAIGLVLLAVFVPTAFVSGIPGQFYRQFAVTISAAAMISLLVSLTLSPALAALLLKPHSDHAPSRKGPRWMRLAGSAGARFNSAFDELSERYGRLTARLIRASMIVLIVYGGLLLLTGWRLTATPSGFIPDQDQGYLIAIVNLPPGASLQRTDDVVKKIDARVLKMDGVDRTVAFTGLDGASQSSASNVGTMFIVLDDWSERGKGMAATDMAGKVMQAVGDIQGASVFVLAPPPVQGLGNGGGFKMMIQDRDGVGYRQLEQATQAMMGAARQTPEVAGVFSQFNTASPRVNADVDRQRALLLGVQPADVYNTMGSYLGSSYVNDFTLGGRTFRVTAQAEPSGRDSVSDIAGMKVRSASGAMVPIGSVTRLTDDTGPVRVVRYNLFPAAELLGSAAPGVSSAQALKTMEALAAKTLPPGVSYEWTDIAAQEKSAGNTAGLVFGMAVILVFLVLAAQYEAFTLPLAVILIVPMCILAAMVGVNLRGQDNNILTQVGLVVLVALAAKNAILIVEFAKQAEEHGQDRFQAAVTAARTRLRPILMTSLAFIFGVIPLMIASGPGQEMRQALGTTVFFGMLGVTFFGLVFTPVFYVVCRWVAGKLPKGPAKATRPVQSAPEGGQA